MFDGKSILIIDCDHELMILDKFLHSYVSQYTEGIHSAFTEEIRIFAGLYRQDNQQPLNMHNFYPSTNIIDDSGAIIYNKAHIDDGIISTTAIRPYKAMQLLREFVDFLQYNNSNNREIYTYNPLLNNKEDALISPYAAITDAGKWISRIYPDISLDSAQVIIQSLERIVCVSGIDIFLSSNHNTLYKTSVKDAVFKVFKTESLKEIRYDEYMESRTWMM